MEKSEFEDAYTMAMKVMNHLDAHETPKMFADAQFMMAQVFLGLKDHNMAMSQVDHVIEFYDRMYGRQHSTTAQAVALRGEILSAKGQQTSAVKDLDEAISVLLLRLGEKHSKTIHAIKKLKGCMANTGLAHSQLNYLKTHNESILHI